MSNSEREEMQNEIDLIIGESILNAISKPKQGTISHDDFTSKAMQLIDTYVESQKREAISIVFTQVDPYIDPFYREAFEELQSQQKEGGE